MVAQHLLDAVLSLEPGEQMELIDLLSQRLNGPAVPKSEPGVLAKGTLSDEHRRVLDERLDEVERDPYGEMSWEQAKAEILAGLGEE